MNENNNQVTNQNEQTNLMNQYNQQPNLTNMGQYNQQPNMTNMTQYNQQPNMTNMTQYNQQPNMTNMTQYNQQPNMNNMGQYSQPLTMNNLNQDGQPLTMNNLNQYGQPLNSNNGFPVATTEGEAKIMNIVSTISLIYKRVVIGGVILLMLFLSLFDIIMLKQTIEARNYIDTTAQFVEIKEDEENSSFNEALYSFTDKNGQNQIIYVSTSSSTPPDEIKIKYDENNPQEFYQENQVLDKGGITGLVVKFIIIALLIFLFFNKNLLSKIHITASRG